jgi:anti-sigma regulatory factor (Ser/Thr protein kinase)
MAEKLIDKINIRIPCNPEYGQLVRLAVSSIASRMNFPFDEIEKLKQALSVVCNYFALKHQQKSVEISMNIYPKKLIVTIDHGKPEQKNARKQLEKLITTLLINNCIDNFKVSNKIYLEKVLTRF